MLLFLPSLSIVSYDVKDVDDDDVVVVVVVVLAVCLPPNKKGSSPKTRTFSGQKAFTGTFRT